MKKQTITIIIPAFNEANRLARCLDSVARQISMPDEVIVVDNNSTDDTAIIAQQYPFVRVVRARKQGIVHARNAGFNAATSDILARIDADTILDADWILNLQRYYESNCGAVTGSSYWHNLPGKEAGRRVNNAIIYHYNYLISGYYPLWGSNMALLASDWAKIKNEVCLRNDIHEDLDLAYHLHAQAVPIYLENDLRNGAEMRRSFESRQKLKAYTNLWPTTYRVHGQYTWRFAWLGAQFLRSMQWVPSLFSKFGHMATGLRRSSVPYRR